MRLLFVSSLYAPEAMGGAELTLERIADGLVARGHQVAVLTTGRDTADNTLPSGVLVMRRRIANLFPLAPVRRHSAVARTLWHLLDCLNPGGYLQGRRAIRRFRPDVVITDTLGGLSVAIWPAAAHERVPVVHRICDAYLLSPSLNMLFARSETPAAAFRRLVRVPHRRLSRHVAAVISLSGAILDLHRKAGLFRQTPTEIIPTAFDLEPPRPLAVAGPLRLGFIGQLIPTKGIETLLQGFIAADVDATLDIAGSGEASYVGALRQRFADPRIRFVGWVSDKPSFFSTIDLSLVPSRIFDTLPTVIIESFANHVPVLASPVGGIPEMIVAGRNGILADLSGPAQIAAAIRSIALDPHATREMSKTTAAVSSRFLNPSTQLDRWEAVLRNAVG
jgi:glycosyltransferase involved in cell wall biosynthesis